MNKLISIILPCYKAEKFIGNIINDVTNQTYQDWELLVISNGEGQDSQLSIIDGFRKIDNRINLFSIPTGGVSLARNIGLQNAVGDWITFLDADDRIDDNHLQLYVDALERENWKCDMVVGGYYFVKGSNCVEEKIIQSNDLKDFILTNNTIMINALWNKIFRKQTIGNEQFKFGYTVSEDVHFNLRVYRNLSKMVSIPMTGYRYYWLDNGNATSKYHACREEVQRENDKLLYELYLLCGLSKEQARVNILNSKYIETYFLVINLYKRGCPLGFWQKRKKIRQLLFEDYEIKEAYDLYPLSRQSIYVKFLTIGYKLHSPLLITIFYSILFYIKNKIIRR